MPMRTGRVFLVLSDSSASRKQAVYLLAAEVGRATWPNTARVYRLQFLGHRIEPYAALALAESCVCRSVSGVMNPCRSISQMVLWLSRNAIHPPSSVRGGEGLHG